MDDRHLEPLRRYRETVSRLFPHEARRDRGNDLSMVEVIFLSRFLDHHPRDVVAVEAGHRPGSSTFWLASRPGVTMVLVVDAASLVSEVVESSGVPSGGDEAPSPESRTLNEFSAVLAEHHEEREKIQLLDGGVGGAISEKGPSGGEGLIVLLTDPGNRREVHAVLAEVFRLHPQVVVFLGGCRGDRSPFVQAGVADFLESSQGTHGFRLIADLGPALAGSAMGIVYAEGIVAETEASLSRVAREFSQTLDPLRLLGREEELMATVTDLNRRLLEAAGREEGLAGEHRALLKERARLQNKASGLRKRISNLEAQIKQLRALQSSRRYRLADALAEKALRLPVLGKLARKD